MMHRAFTINNPEDHRRAITLITELWDSAPGTDEAQFRDVMSCLVHQYEEETTTLYKVLLFRSGESPAAWAEREGLKVRYYGFDILAIVDREWHVVFVNGHGDHEVTYDSETLWPDGTGRDWPGHWQWAMLPEQESIHIHQIDMGIQPEPAVRRSVKIEKVTHSVRPDVIVVDDTCCTCFGWALGRSPSNGLWYKAIYSFKTGSRIAAGPVVPGDKESLEEFMALLPENTEWFHCPECGDVCEPSRE